MSHLDDCDHLHHGNHLHDGRHGGGDLKTGHQAERFCVKELAVALQVGAHFIYQMRTCGFRMGRQAGRRGSQTATVEEAIHWIMANDFRLVKGRGVIKGHNSKG